MSENTETQGNLKLFDSIVGIGCTPADADYPGANASYLMDLIEEQVNLLDDVHHFDARLVVASVAAYSYAPNSREQSRVREMLEQLSGWYE